MNEKENTSTLNRKKLIYSVIISVCALLLIAAIVLTVYFVTTGGNEIAENPPVDDNPPAENPPADNPPAENPPDDKPSGGDGKVTFIVPVEAASCTVEYDAIYNNRSLDRWYKHLAVDYAAEEGAAVSAMADGKVVEISLDETLGNLITIEHSGGLKSIYRFVEPESGLKVGDQVSCGQKIATVAAAYGTEYKDGTHLHLEMELNGENVDPTVYIDQTLEEK